MRVIKVFCNLSLNNDQLFVLNNRCVKIAQIHSPRIQCKLNCIFPFYNKNFPLLIKKNSYKNLSQIKPIR